MKQEFDAVILGAGATGLMCAIEAGRRGFRIALLERAEKAGKKILISGGGRCNFTNLHCGPQNFLSENPDFCRSALARYTPADFLKLVEKHKIPYHEKRPYPEAAPGQLFCDRSATDILGMLLEECATAGVRIFLNTNVREIKHDGGFAVRATQAGQPSDLEFTARALVVATGGLSIPKMGATGFGYDVARQFGHPLVPCQPGLVPLTFNRSDARAFCDLAGVSALVRASCGGVKFPEKMLITHRGLSGPAILQVSSYWKWKKDSAVTIDLAPGQDWTAPLRNGAGRRDLVAARSALRKVLPQRLADRWIERHEPEDWTNRSLERMEEAVHRWEIRPAGTEGYEKAEVTAGGVDTAGLSSKTMESKKVPGLFFIGEVVDVTGWLGGFNFQWAWASGAAAGRAIRERV
ncbi:MAG: NAD(P)/FAD-dependent oxidoreductase [Candidatus Acidiferrum sp.]|jgi:predicted Rossmann fold flavoprotein